LGSWPFPIILWFAALGGVVYFGLTVLMGLAMPAALLFLSGLFRALRQAEGATARLALAALGGGACQARGHAPAFGAYTGARPPSAGRSG
jgi:hypothetical protein